MKQITNPPKELVNKIEPKSLDDLTQSNPQKGAIYLCMVCGTEFEKGKNARGHACKNEHRRWIRHPKLPNTWNNPYKILAENKVEAPNAY